MKEYSINIRILYGYIGMLVAIIYLNVYIFNPLKS